MSCVVTSKICKTLDISEKPTESVYYSGWSLLFVIIGYAAMYNVH